MSAVVLDGGEGSRLRPLTKHRPEPLLPAATTPILEHVFDQSLEAGVIEITVVVGYGRNRVQAHFGSTYPGVPGDVQVRVRVFEEESLGALLGDRVEDRGGCTYVPGAVVGSEAAIEAGAPVRGTLAEETEVRS